MLLLAAIICFFAAFACLRYERESRLWYLDRWLIASAGFFVALALVSAAWWAWRLVP
jgi:hypothetical protein